MKERIAADLIKAEDALTYAHLMSETHEMRSHLAKFQKAAAFLNVPQTLLYAARLYAESESMDALALLDKVQILKERWNDELSSVKFLELSVEEAKRYEGASSGFGVDVSKAFPSANYDCAECVCCLALGRYTAAVVHAMRCLESPLRAMSKALKLRCSAENWNELIERLQNKWKIIERRRNKPKGWKQDRQFYSEAFVELLYIKDAWRNWAMHARSVYGETEANKITSHAANLMRHLALRFRE